MADDGGESDRILLKVGFMETSRPGSSSDPGRLTVCAGTPGASQPFAAPSRRRDPVHVAHPARQWGRCLHADRGIDVPSCVSRPSRSAGGLVGRVQECSSPPMGPLVGLKRGEEGDPAVESSAPTGSRGESGRPGPNRRPPATPAASSEWPAATPFRGSSGRWGADGERSRAPVGRAPGSRRGALRASPGGAGSGGPLRGR